MVKKKSLNLSVKGKREEVKLLAPFDLLKVKNTILGPKYSLSIVFAQRNLIQKLNKIYRKKDKATDILSFPLSKDEGEIFLNLNEAKIEAKKFDRKIDNFIPFLLIHGMCHLKGMQHGSKMEEMEKKFRRKFSV